MRYLTPSNIKFWLTSLFLMTDVVCWSQNVYHGKVMDKNQAPVPYANIVQLKPTDSTYVSGSVSDENGSFSFIPRDSTILKISSVGFRECYLADYQDGMTITLDKDTHTLQGVEVVSNKPLTRMEGDALVTNVKGTILSQLGSLRDVLSQTPGLISNGGSVEVFGKGAPVIYINGRQMRSNLELDQISSQKVKKIEVVTNPGAKYDATVKAVIRITTEKDAGEGLALENKITGSQGDYFTGLDILNVNYRERNLDVFGTATGSFNKQRGSSTNVQETWASRYIRQDIDMAQHSRSHTLNGKVGFDYTPSKNQSLGAYYEVTRVPAKVNTDYQIGTSVDQVLQTSSFMNQASQQTGLTHLVDGYYSGSFGKWSIDANLDFLWKKNEKQQISSQKESSQQSLISISDNDHGRMMAGKIEISRDLWKGNITFGTEDTYSRRTDLFLNKEQVFKNVNNKILETNAGLYAEMSQRFNKISLRLGLRYEYVNSDYYEEGHKIEGQSFHSSRLFPTALIVVPVGKTVLQFSYAKKYIRPLYSQLSNTITYVNNYLYESGNPLLRSSYADNMSINFKYSWFLIVAAWNHITGKIINSSEAYQGNSTITLIKKQNSSQDLNELQLMVMLMPQIGKWYPQLMGGILAQLYDIDYRGEIERMNRPIFMVRWNNMLQFPKGILGSVNLGWRSNGDAENLTMGSSWQVSCSASKNFGRNWNLKLGATDIFNTSRHSRFTMYSDISRIHFDKNITNRNVEITLSYRFNMSKSKYKGKGTGEDEIKRL